MESKTILITGGAGFIGSHTVDLFIENGHSVICVDNLASSTEKYIHSRAIFYKMDINDSALETIFQKHSIDVIIHFAAQVSVSHSIHNPHDDAMQNIIGSIHLISLAKKYTVKKIIVASTAAVYGNPISLPIKENHPLNPISYYGLSKLTMETYLKQFDLSYVILRFSNIYGERQTAHGEAGVISIFSDAMIANKEIKIFGDGEQTRDFLYVKDVANACYQVATIDIKNTIMNVSSNSFISLNKLFDIMAKIFNYKQRPVYCTARKGDILHSILDNNYLRNEVNWQPAYSLDNGLKNLKNFL